MISRSLSIAASLALLAAMLLLHDLFAPLPEVVIPPAPPVNFTLSAAAPVPAPDPRIYATISSRPIFSPTRRPPPVVAGPAAPPSGPPAIDFSLIGVVNAPGQRFGLVTVAGSASAVLVRPGSVIEGWTVTKINASSIVVRFGDTTDVLNFMP